MVKEIRARKKRKRNWNKIIGILLFITIMGSLITFSALRQISSQSPPPVKPYSSEYFTFSEVTAVANSSGSTNATIQVISVGFKITPIGGNATDLIILPRDGMYDEQDTFIFAEIINGTSVQVGEITYPHEVPAEWHEEENGWGPLKFQITCNEAGGGERGKVKIYITERFLL